MRRTDPDVPRGVVLALVGGAVLAVAAIVPWSATADQSYTGFEHVDGYVTFGIGVAAGILALEALAVERRWGWLGRVAAGVGSLAVLGLALKWYWGILETAGSWTRIGLHLTLAGGLALLAAAVVGLRIGDDESDAAESDAGQTAETRPADSRPPDRSS